MMKLLILKIKEQINNRITLSLCLLFRSKKDRILGSILIRRIWAETLLIAKKINPQRMVRSFQFLGKIHHMQVKTNWSLETTLLDRLNLLVVETKVLTRLKKKYPTMEEVKRKKKKPKNLQKHNQAQKVSPI